jgi:tetratricopeptide (TPR) repeat protein
MIGAASLSMTAHAQTARASGLIRDTGGKPVTGATIRALDPDAGSRLTVSTSDSKGRWSMLGLRAGTYTFVVDAPGFFPVRGSAQVRTTPSSPLVFTLSREAGPGSGEIPSNIQSQISAANLMRDQGRFDQAIAAYQEIRAKHPTLTALNLVIGEAYRRKAALVPDATSRRAALDRAIECYTEMLKADPNNERAHAELASTRAEAAAVAPH